jgi:hypothetical protein
MIFVWLAAAARWIIRLFLPPPAEVVVPKIDPSAPCPSCGNCSGTIAAVQVEGKMMVQHSCKVCAARWFENPVLKDPVATSTTTVIHAAPAKAA